MTGLLPLLMLPLLLLGACTSRAPVTVSHGKTVIEVGHRWAWAGKTFDRIHVDESGGLTMTTRDDLEGAWRDTMLAAAGFAGTYYGARVAVARSANRTAASLAAGRQATAVRAIEAREAIALDQEATRRFLAIPPGTIPP